jgi:epoxyqueuosine reductase QueG
MLAIEAVALEHHINNHDICGKWCPVNKGNTSKKYRSKEIYGKLFAHLQTVMGKYTTKEKLRQLHHDYSTQGNEAMNQSVTSYPPKNKTYSTTMSLHKRVKMAASIQIVGHVEFWRQVHHKL